MREIMFKGKRIDDDKWVFGYYFKTPLTEENSGVRSEYGRFFLSDGETRHCISDEFGVCYVVDEKTIGQYIGRKDKNGTEIYDGDIIRTRSDYEGDNFYKSENFKVYFEDGAFITDSMLCDCFYNCELLGNIHENADLLKG